MAKVELLACRISFPIRVANLEAESFYQDIKAE
jgi:hypothetical protein